MNAGSAHLRRLALGIEALVLVLAVACAYVLPATWRSFRADPDDAAPAITRALDGENMAVANWEQANHRITTSWVMSSSGVNQTRERFVINWERDPRDAVLTIYVRHEAQDKEQSDGPSRWSATYHSAGRETALLDRIAKELNGGR